MRANKVHVEKLIHNLLPCCNLKIFLRNKMLSRSYFIYLTKAFGSINKIFGGIKKTIQAKTLVN